MCAGAPTGPALDTYEYHFNQLGVQLGATIEDKAVPLKGGKLYIELPVYQLINILVGEPTVLSKLLVPFKEEMYLLYTPSIIERLRDVTTMKAAITYKAANYKSGEFDITMDYTFVHPDNTEETGTLHLKGTGGKMMMMEVVNKNAAVMPKFVLHPFKIEASITPNSQIKMHFKGSHGVMDMTLLKQGQKFKIETVYKVLDYVYNYIVEMDVAAKKMKVVHTEQGVEINKLEFEMQGNLFSLKKISMKGKIQATRWWNAGPVESIFLAKGNDYEFNISHNKKDIVKSKINIVNMKMKSKVNFDFTETYKGIMYINYDTATKKFEMTLPKEWFYDQKTLGMTFTVRSTTPFIGGVYELVFLRDTEKFYKVDLDFELIWNPSKIEFVVNHLLGEVLNGLLVDNFFYNVMPISKYDFCQKFTINGCYAKGEMTARVFIDRVNKNYLINKFKVETNVKKADKEVLDIKMDTTVTPYHFSVFYPRVFLTKFNKPYERLTLDVEHKTGPMQTLTLATNYEDLKFIFTFAKYFTTLKTLITKHNIPMMDYNMEYKYAAPADKLSFDFTETLKFDERSLIHKTLCSTTDFLCFKEWAADVKIDIPSIAAKTVEILAICHQDGVEAYHLEVNNKAAPYKFIMKSPYILPIFRYITSTRSWLNYIMPSLKTPFDVVIKYHPTEKSLKVETNIDASENLMEIMPLGGDKYKMEWNHEEVVQFLAAAKKIEVVKTLKDGSIIKPTMTWTKQSLVDNTATLKVLYKNIPIEFTCTWNMNDLKKGAVKFHLKGEKVSNIGTFELMRDAKWTVKSDKLEMKWSGKAASSAVPYLTTPILTDVVLSLGADGKTHDIKVEKKLNGKTYTFHLSTVPFKIALLPFFEM